MTLDDLALVIQRLQFEGHGSKEVWVLDDEYGPYALQPGAIGISEVTNVTKWGPWSPRYLRGKPLEWEDIEVVMLG